MRKFLTATLIVALFTSCGGSSSKNATESKEHDKSSTVAQPTKLINEIGGYFVTYEPNNLVEVLIQDEIEWNANFGVAKTMDNQPTTIDFSIHKVGAIVAPTTDVETNIVIDNASIKDRKLVVEYSINTKGEKRSFTIVPMKAFFYNITQDIDSVSFVTKGVATTLPK